MSLAEAWQNIEAHLRADADSVRARIEQDIPEVAQFLNDAASSPVTAALSAAVHVPQAPAALAMVAAFIGQLDGVLAAEKAAAAQPQP